MSSETVVVPAAELVPNVFANEPKHFANDVLIDARNLAVFDQHPVDLEAFQKDKEGYLKERSRDAFQQLINSLFTLPTEVDDDIQIAVLPKKSPLTIPREKPIPEPKPETKWERFAKEKGITKKKRDRMVFDEDSKEWRPRYGYKRANDGLMDHPIIEVRPGDDENTDPWNELHRAKKARVMKNKIQQARNIERFQSKPPVGIPIDLNPTNTDGYSEGAPKKKGRKLTAKTLEIAQYSTASLGKFDRRLDSEPERKKTGVKKKFDPVVSSKKDNPTKEIDRMNQILKSVMIRKEKTKKSAPSDNIAYDGLPAEGYGMTSKKRDDGKSKTGKLRKITKKRAK